MKTKTPIITIIALFISTLVFAQGKDFSGKWTLAKRTSISGPDYVNGVPAMIEINQKGDSISFKRTIPAQDNKTEVSNETLSLNGKTKSRISTNPKRSIRAAITFSPDKQSLLENWTLSAEGNPAETDARITENFSLSADGKTLTLEKHFASTKKAEDKWDMKGEYQKTP